jgi:hypothetical protein
MNLIKNYRPEGFDVEISEGNIVKLMVVRENPRLGIIARVRGIGRIVLWDGEDVEPNREASEEQVTNRLIEKINTGSFGR